MKKVVIVILAILFTELSFGQSTPMGYPYIQYKPDNGNYTGAEVVAAAKNNKNLLNEYVAAFQKFFDEDGESTELPNGVVSEKAVEYFISKMPIVNISFTKGEYKVYYAVDKARTNFNFSFRSTYSDRLKKTIGAEGAFEFDAKQFGFKGNYPKRYPILARCGNRNEKVNGGKTGFVPVGRSLPSHVDVTPVAKKNLFVDMNQSIIQKTELEYVPEKQNLAIHTTNYSVGSGAVNNPCGCAQQIYNQREPIPAINDHVFNNGNGPFPWW